MRFGQVANFKTNSNIPIDKFAIAINSNLKKAIRIQSAEEVEERFHSRLSCKRKTYRYVINCSEQGTAIYRNLETHIPMKLDIEKMQKAAKYFEGEHDFKAFVTDNKERENCVRKIFKASIDQQENKLVFTFIGNGFLRYQVRNMIGYLIKIGEEKATPESVIKVLESKDRTKSGKTAPAEGLYLYNVEY